MRATTRTSQSGLLGYLSLFTSLTTLIFCALPTLLVLLGLGATVVSIVSSAPWLITLSRHKNWVFALAGLLIGLNVVYVLDVAPRLRSTSEACPVDRPSACGAADRVSRLILWFSLGIYIVGFFAAYLLGPILRFLG